MIMSGGTRHLQIPLVVRSVSGFAFGLSSILCRKTGERQARGSAGDWPDWAASAGKAGRSGLWRAGRSLSPELMHPRAREATLGQVSSDVIARDPLSLIGLAASSYPTLEVQSEPRNLWRVFTAQGPFPHACEPSWEGQLPR